MGYDGLGSAIVSAAFNLEIKYILYSYGRHISEPRDIAIDGPKEEFHFYV